MSQSFPLISFQRHTCERLNSRDVLLRLAELLGEVFGGGFAGDLDERELLAVACGVARSLTHAVLVVPLHQVRYGKTVKK